MAKNTCTSCGGSGVVKNEKDQPTLPRKMDKEKNPSKPKDYKFKSNAQRKSPLKEKN